MGREHVLESRGSRHGAPSLRAKFIVALGAIVVLFVLAMVASESGIRSLEGDLDDFSDRVLPRSEALLEIVSEVTELDRLVASAGTLRSSGELEELEAGIQSRLARASVLIEQVGEDGAALENGILELSAGAEDLLGVRREQLEHEDRLAAMISRLLEKSHELRVLLEVSLLIAEAEPDVEFASRELRLGLLNVESTLAAVPDAREERRLQTMEDRLRLEARRLVRLLSGLPAGQRRTASIAVSELMEGATGLGGALRTGRRIAELDRRILDIDSEVIAARRNLRDEGQGIASRRSMEVAEARTDSKDRAARARLAVRLAFLGTLVLTVLVLVFVVQRSFVGQLRRLVDDLTRLSQGELDVEVSPAGDSEFAQLASAAEVFRQNARELERTMETLAERNASLGEFAHVASHDLKTPLRAITNLSQWVLEDCEGILPGESSKHLELLRNRAERMESLLEGLLRYSRLGNDESIHERIQFGDLMEDVLSVVVLPPEVNLGVEGADCEWLAVKAPIQLVLRNLIQNAVRHSDRERPSIVVSAAPWPGAEEEAMQIVVRDDGPGIPPNRQAEAFRIFRQLEPDDPGTGMGLALVRRAVDLSGGSLELDWSEPHSEPPRGCAFTIRWPVGADRRKAPRTIQSSGSSTTSQ